MPKIITLSETEIEEIPFVKPEPKIDKATRKKLLNQVEEE